MTKLYINSQLSMAVGQQDVYADLDFDIVDGYVHRVLEADLIQYTTPDTSSNTVYVPWMSVLKDGRLTYDPIADGFPGDIIGLSVFGTGYSIAPFETQESGYLADDPYFESRVRLGWSTISNVAGGAISLMARVVAERVKATSEIRALMYNRSYS